MYFPLIQIFSYHFIVKRIKLQGHKSYPHKTNFKDAAQLKIKRTIKHKANLNMHLRTSTGVKHMPCSAADSGSIPSTI